MINVGIIGATGYAGSELVRLLYNRKDINIVSLGSNSYEGQNFGDIYENFRHIDDLCTDNNIERMAETCDVIFLALPHGIAGNMITENILSETKIIDLGADFRIKDVSEYEKWYGVKAPDKNLLDEAVYGLCEINREKIKNARIIANPGCYTTCSILSLYPLVKEGLIDVNNIIVDAKSGVSGAGRGANLSSLYCEVNESIKAYKVLQHRHTPEIEEQLTFNNIKPPIVFTPHLTPMNRGILATCYTSPIENISYEDVKKVYEKYYKDEYFIRLTKEGILPETKWVKGTNFVDIGFALDDRTSKIVVIGCIDNVFKGAAGQAVQNMNIMFGLDEKTGVDMIAPFPV